MTDDTPITARAQQYTPPQQHMDPVQRLEQPEPPRPLDDGTVRNTGTRARNYLTTDERSYNYSIARAQAQLLNRVGARPSGSARR